MSARGAGRWLSTVVAVLVAALAPAAAGAVPAPAHARLNGSDPAAGSVVARAPSAVALTFNRDIAPPATVVVTAPDGDRVGAGEPAVQGREVSAPIAAQREGTYAVAFRAVSVDGHPITGRFTFSVGHRSAPPTATSSGGGHAPWRWAAGLCALAVFGVGLLTWRRRRTVGGAAT